MYMCIHMMVANSIHHDAHGSNGGSRYGLGVISALRFSWKLDHTASSWEARSALGLAKKPSSWCHELGLFGSGSAGSDRY